MSVQTTPHINFRGEARAALEFYASAVGGQTTLVTYEDQHSVQNPDEAQWIMWGQAEAPNGFRVMAFDMPSARPYDQGVASFFIALRGETVEEITAIWEKLAAGADILTPLGPAPWAPDSAYGMLTDRFGVTWVEQTCAATLALLREAPATTAQLRMRLPALEERLSPPDRRGAAPTPVAPRVLTVLAASGCVVRGMNNGGWKVSRPYWIPTAAWLGSPVQVLTEFEGYAELIGRWLWSRY